VLFSHFREAFLKTETWTDLNSDTTAGPEALFEVYFDISLPESTLVQSHMSRIDWSSRDFVCGWGVKVGVAGIPDVSLLIIYDILMAQLSSKFLSSTRGKVFNFFCFAFFHFSN
jgi:hypothetical protein